jgi:Protein of unknown function (DUF1194)
MNRISIHLVMRLLLSLVMVGYRELQLLGSWAVLDTPASALAFADHIANSPRQGAAGGTAIGAALDRARRNLNGR